MAKKHNNKTRGLRRWPTRETIVLRCNKSPWNFRKISHPELEISLNLSDFSKEVCQLPDWQTYKKFRIIWNQCTNISGMSSKDSKKIQKNTSSRAREILIFFYLLWKHANYQTERQNYLEPVYQHPRNVSMKFEKYISSRTGDIFINVWYQQWIKSNNRLKDIEEMWKYLELVYEHPSNVSKRFQKDISSRARAMNEWR